MFGKTKNKIKKLEQKIETLTSINNFLTKQNTEILDLLEKQVEETIDLNVKNHNFINFLQNLKLYINSSSDILSSGKKWLLKDINNVLRKGR